MIKQGQALPSATLSELTKDGMVNHSTDELFANKTVVLFALPGAFTPTCSEAHLPGYVVLADKLKAKGAAPDALSLLQRLHAASKGTARVRIDANGSWDRAAALDFLQQAPPGSITGSSPTTPGPRTSCVRPMASVMRQ